MPLFIVGEFNFVKLFVAVRTFCRRLSGTTRPAGHHEKISCEWYVSTHYVIPTEGAQRVSGVYLNFRIIIMYNVYEIHSTTPSASLGMTRKC